MRFGKAIWGRGSGVFNLPACFHDLGKGMSPQAVVFFSLVLLFAVPVLGDQFTTSPASQSVIEGSRVSLQCNYSTPASISWQKDNGSLPSSVQDHMLSPSSSELTIPAANHMQHAGEYRCVANSSGESLFSPPITLTVYYITGMPSIMVTGAERQNPNVYRAEVGSGVTLQCTPLTGVPAPDTSWTFIDIMNDTPQPIVPAQSVQVEDNGRRVVLSSVETAHIGEYLCNTSNVAGSASSMVELKVFSPVATVPTTPPPPVVKAVQAINCGRVGGAVNLSCMVTPNGAEVSWAKGSTSVTSPRFSPLCLGNLCILQITDLESSDAGQYKCSAGSSSDILALNLHCITNVEITSSNGLVKPVGRPFSLECSVHLSSGVDASLSYDIIWRHNGSLIVGGARVAITGSRGNTLTISKAELQDTGNYSCTAEGPFATPNTRSVSLTVEADPVVRLFADPERAKLNHSLTITCTTSSTHSPRLTWYRGSSELVSKGNQVQITNDPSGQNSTLVITRFLPMYGSSEVFRCVASDSLGRNTIKSISINMTTELYLTRKLGQVCMLENSSLSVTCPVAGGIGHVLVRWYHGSKEMSNTSLVTIRDSTLTFRSVKRRMEDHYQCIATDNASQRVVEHFNLSVFVPGYFISYPVGKLYYDAGTRVAFSCITDGHPLPEVGYVHRYQERIKNDSHYIVFPNGTLIIKNLSSDEVGIYSCFFQIKDSGASPTKEFMVELRSTHTTQSTPGGILGLPVNTFVGVIVGAVGGLFLLLTLLLLLSFACYYCCYKRRQLRNGMPKTLLETTSFERRPSVRNSLRKDNSGILVQSPSNLSNLWVYTADQHKNHTPLQPTGSMVSGSMAVSPGPPVPSPIPPSIDPVGSLITMEEEDGFPLGLPNFPRQNLKVGEVMGEGEFGPVLRGVARQLVRGEEHTEVAVKVLMRREGEMHPRNIIADFVNQMNLSSPNICCILGLCTDSEPFYVIYQYLDRGDLKQFLIDSRPTPTRGPILSQSQLKRIIQQVAHGMNYLYTQQIIHGDLATRNCLISSSLSVKIADLGIGHDLYGEDYYDNGSQLLPVRWMAPELLVESSDGPAFSLASDIWSYGVLCWEVFSFAQQPYAELTDEQVLRTIPAGHCLGIPEDGCPSLLYSLMQDCWASEPFQRPLFNHISSALHSIEVY